MHELLVKCTHTYERINRVSRNFMENRRGSVFTVLRVHFISDVYGHLLLAPDHPRQRIQTSILLCTRARERERKKNHPLHRQQTWRISYPYPRGCLFTLFHPPSPKKDANNSSTQKEMYDTSSQPQPPPWRRRDAEVCVRSPG